MRADVLYGRTRDADGGVGPYASASGAGDWHRGFVGAGASVLVPVHPYLPLVLSGGPVAQWGGATGWAPGASVSAFWGSRGYNYHAPYSMAAGVLVEGRRTFGDAGESSVTVAAVVDVSLLALPAVMLWGALHRSP